MVSRGIPIDGVGMQMHVGAPHDDPPVAEFTENMQRFAELGLEVAITEMDMHVCAGETPEQQAAKYHDIVAACVAQPACGIGFGRMTSIVRPQVLGPPS